MGKLGLPGCPHSIPTFAQEKIRNVLFLKVARVPLYGVHDNVNVFFISVSGTVCS